MERRWKERDRVRECERPDKSWLEVQMTESLYILLHTNISGVFCLPLLPPHPSYPHPLGYSNMAITWETCHTCHGTVSMRFPFFYCCDKEQRWSAGRFKEVVFRNLWKPLLPRRCVEWQFCVRASQAQYSSATLWPRVLAENALINLTLIIII